MSKFTTVLAFASAVLVVTAPAWAQRGGRGGFGLRGNPLFLLRSEAVQTDLKLTDEQKDQLGGLMAEQFAEFQGLAGASPEERRSKMQELAAEAAIKLKELLSKEQHARLDQILLQMRGPSALAQDEYATQLKLDDPQKEKIATIVAEAQEARRGAFQQARESGDRSQVFAKLRELREMYDAQILAVLTDEQKEQWKGLLGDPFDISRLRRGGRGGR